MNRPTPTDIDRAPRDRPGACDPSRPAVPSTHTVDVVFDSSVSAGLRGELPGPAQSRVLESAMVAGVDHGPPAPSIAAARMAATCGPGLNNAVATGVNLLGDVHGGAGQQCVALLNRMADLRSDGTDAGPLESALALERALEQRRGRPVPMNIDGATATVYASLGFDAELARGLFVLSRSVGILAHAWEESNSGARIKGPLPRSVLAGYTGPETRVPGERSDD